MDQLDDGMVFYLASLPMETFRLLEQIYKKFNNADLKSQIVPRSKKGTVTKKLDLKGSQFKCLRGVEMSEVRRLLLEVSDSVISLKEMSSECIAIKHLHKVQAAFVQGTNCTDWNEAREKFPKYTTAEQLEPYKKLDYSGKTLPGMFLKFCQRVLAENQEKTSHTPCADELQTDDSFFVNHLGYWAIFWKMNIKLVTPDKFMSMLKSASDSLSFPGFSLGIFDMTNGKMVSLLYNRI